LELLIVLIVAAVDQLSKLWAAGALVTQHGNSLVLIDGLIGFRYVENRGAAFGMFQDGTLFFLIVTGIAIIALCYVIFTKRKTYSKWGRVGLALLLAGAVGNFIDRLLLGYVRDMIETLFINFPVFNVADIAVCVGAGVLILAVILEERRLAQKEKAAQAIEEAPGQADSAADEEKTEDA